MSRVATCAVMSERRRSCFADRGSTKPSPETPRLNAGQTKPNSRLRAKIVAVFSGRFGAGLIMTPAAYRLLRPPPYREVHTRLDARLPAHGGRGFEALLLLADPLRQRGQGGRR